MLKISNLMNGYSHAKLAVSKPLSGYNNQIAFSANQFVTEDKFEKGTDGVERISAQQVIRDRVGQKLSVKGFKEIVQQKIANQLIAEANLSLIKDTIEQLKPGDKTFLYKTSDNMLISQDDFSDLTKEDQENIGKVPIEAPEALVGFLPVSVAEDRLKRMQELNEEYFELAEKLNTKKISEDTAYTREEINKMFAS